jgi:hypothetical protein
MSRFRECDGCGERLEWNYITLSRSGHLKTDNQSGMVLGGDFDFCGYGCVESWARLLALGSKGKESA